MKNEADRIISAFIARTEMKLYLFFVNLIDLIRKRNVGTHRRLF